MKKRLLLIYFCILNLSFFLISNIDAKIPDTILKQKKAVVTIYINDKDGKQVSTGTGFLIESNGIIATNFHVISPLIIENKKYELIDNSGRIHKLIVKMENGAFFPLEDILSYDKNYDIALLKIDGKELPTVKLATEYKPVQGEDVVVIGSPLGLETTVTDGIISSVRGKSGFIQITAPISPGNSGSPVFNSKGEVIGIATFLIEGGQNLNFAISVKHIVTMLIESKKPKKKITSTQEQGRTFKSSEKENDYDYSGSMFIIDPKKMELTDYFSSQNDIYFSSSNIVNLWVIKRISFTESQWDRLIKMFKGQTEQREPSAFIETIAKENGYTRILYTFDCSKRMVRLSQAIKYSQDGNGEILPISPSNKEFIYIPPNTNIDDLRQQVCVFLKNKER